MRRRLRKVHTGLGRLRALRATVRVGAAASTALTILLWTLLAAFALDYLTRMKQLERSILLLVVLGAAAWTVIRVFLPALRVKESEVELALMVDRQQQMHSDLVAAIQFDDTHRRQYGSGDLREAVVEYTDAASPDLRYLEGFSGRGLVRRFGLFLVSAAIGAIPFLWFGAHTRAFLQRMLLGKVAYPTRTVIKEIISPGDRVAYGHDLEFVVRLGGEVPDEASVKIRTLKTEQETVLRLTRPDKNAPPVFRGTLTKVLDDLEYVVIAGDARSEPRKVRLISLPLPEFEMKVITPAYARGRHKALPGRRREVVVLEGSQVIPIISADKKLTSATLRIDGAKGEYPMRQEGNRFVFDDKDGPLAKIRQTVAFTIDVVDVDGQRPEDPVKGQVHTTADLPPRVVLLGNSRLVVPDATPRLGVKAVDDYALGEIKLHVRVIRARAEEAEQTLTLASLPSHPVAYENGSKPYELALAPLGLAKGDQVVVTAEAVDFRGPLTPESKRSEKWVFDVTDQEGVLRAMGRLEEEMDKKLDQILRAQFDAEAGSGP